MRKKCTLKEMYGLTKEEEIQLLKKEISDIQELIRKKKEKLAVIEDEEESKKLPEYSRHECIECHKHRAGNPVYHDGKLTGYICESCDYEIL